MTSRIFIRLLAAACASLVCGMGHAQPGSLIAHYTFDNGVQDVTGNIEPIDTQADAPKGPGKFGQALRFNGDRIIEIPINLSAQHRPAFTVSMWVKMDPPPTEAAALSAQSNYAVVASEVLGINGRKHENPNFYVEVPGSKFSAGAHVARPSQWKYVVVTRTVEDRANSSGELEPHAVTTITSDGATTERVGPLRSNTHQPSLYLGGSNAQGSSHNFLGLIDDLKIFGALVSAEQAAQSNGGTSAGGSEPNATAGTDLGYITSSPNSGEYARNSGTLNTNRVFPTDQINREIDAEVPVPPAQPEPEIPFNAPIRDGESVERMENPLGRLNEANQQGEQAIESNEIDRTVIGSTGVGQTDSSNTYQRTMPTTSGAIDPSAEPADDAATMSHIKAKADWQVTQIALRSEYEEAKLRSGDRVSLRVKVRRLDLADKLPDATLAITAVPAAGGAQVVQQIPLSQAGDGVAKNYSVLLEVPVIGADGKPLSTTNLIVTGQINYPQRLLGIDANLSNNTKQVPFLINKREESSDVTESLEACERAVAKNQDGDHLTKKNCLVSNESSGSKQPIAHRVYFESDVLQTYTQVSYAARQGNATVQNILLDSRLFDIHWKEKKDKPCELDINSESEPKGVKLCDGEIHSWKSARVSDSKDEVVTGIRVCRNAKNRRLKGISLQFRKIDEEGNLSQEEGFDFEERTNCAKRTAWEYCPGRTIARGLRVRIADGTFLAPQKFIHSLDLICSEPSIRER